MQRSTKCSVLVWSTIVCMCRFMKVKWKIYNFLTKIQYLYFPFCFQTDLVRTSSSSSKASPSVRTSSRISPSPPMTSAGGLAPPPGGASTAPATAAAGFQVSSSSAANPAMSAFGGVSGRFSVASPTTAVGSSASAISRQLTPTFRWTTYICIYCLVKTYIDFNTYIHTYL